MSVTGINSRSATEFRSVTGFRSVAEFRAVVDFRSVTGSRSVAEFAFRSATEYSSGRGMCG